MAARQHPLIDLATRPDWATLSTEQKLSAASEVAPELAQVSKFRAVAFLKRLERKYRPARVPGTEKTGRPGVPMLRPKVSEVDRWSAYTEGEDLLSKAVRASETLDESLAKSFLGGIRGIGGGIEAIGEYLTSTAQEQGKKGYVGRPVRAIGKAIAGTMKKAEESEVLNRVTGRPEMQEKFAADPLETPEVLLDPDYIAYMTGQGAGSMLSMLLPGIAAMGRAERALKVLQIKDKWIPALSVALGGGVGSFVETFIDAGLNQQEALENGASPEVAARLFAETMKREFPTTAAFNAVGIFNPAVKSGLRRWALSVLTESLQEPAQGIAQRTAYEAVTGEPVDVTGPLAGEAVAGLLGATVAGPVIGKVGERISGGQRGQAGPEIVAEPAPEAQTTPAAEEPPRASAEAAQSAAEGDLYSQALEAVRSVPTGRISRRRLADQLGLDAESVDPILERMVEEGVLTPVDDSGLAVYEIATEPRKPQEQPRVTEDAAQQEEELYSRAVEAVLESGKKRVSRQTLVDALKIKREKAGELLERMAEEGRVKRFQFGKNTLYHVQPQAKPKAEETPAPREAPYVPFKSARESAEVFERERQPKSARESAQVFLKAEAKRRRQAEKPVIPETGTSEEEQRLQDARDRVARNLIGKYYDELDDADRGVVDALVNEGYGFTAAQEGQERTKAKPAPQPKAGPSEDELYDQAKEVVFTREKGGKPALYAARSEIAKQLGIKPDEAQALLDRMAEEGLVTRHGKFYRINREADWYPGGRRNSRPVSRQAGVEPQAADSAAQTPRGETASTAGARPVPAGVREALPGTPAQETGPEEHAAGRRAAPRVTGKLTRVKTARGRAVDVEYAVADAGDLVTSHDTALNPNPDYPQALQPRDRTRAASLAQVESIAGKLDPEELGENYKASDGAPIVGPDLVVESGNARTIALKRVYEQGLEQAEKYKSWLRENAERFGLKPEEIDTVERPVLVRVRRTDVNRAEFAKEANEASVAAMSPVEQAKSDAERLSDEVMQAFVPSETGEIATADNREFVRLFFKQVIPETERGEYQLPDGSLSKAGIDRIRNAIFAKAYGASGALEKLAEDPDANIKAIVNGMLRAAPKFAALNTAIADGVRHDLSISRDIAQAAEKLSALRENKTKVADYLAQQAMFGEDIGPVAKNILQVFDRYKRSGKRIGEILSRYADMVEALGDPNQGGLFGGPEVPTKTELLQTVVDRAEEELRREAEIRTSREAARDGEAAEADREDRARGKSETEPEERSGEESERYSRIGRAGRRSARITLEAVARAFPKADVAQTDSGDFIVTLPGGRTIYIQPDATILVNADAFQKGYGRRYAGEPIYGSYRRISRGALIQLAKLGGDEHVLNHEAFHAAMDLALTPAEKRVILKKFGDEERAAEAYARWTDEPPPTSLFAKIRRYFRRLVARLFNRPEAIFGKIRGGEVWERTLESAVGPRRFSAREIGPHGPIFREFRHDAEGAIKKLMEVGTGEAVAALYHPEVGDIDLIWGRATKSERGRPYGLAHILEKHGRRTLEELPSVFPKLKRVPEKDAGNNLVLENETHRAVVTTEWRGSHKVWLLTFYAPKKPSAPGGLAGVPEAPVAGAGETTPSPAGGSPPSGRSIGVPGSARKGGGGTPPPGGDTSSITRPENRVKGKRERYSIFDESERQTGLFGESEKERLEREAKRYEDKLLGDRLTAQFRSPMTREEQLAKLKRKPLETQVDMFAEEKDEPQGSFDFGEPKYSVVQPYFKRKLTPLVIRNLKLLGRSLKDSWVKDALKYFTLPLDMRLEQEGGGAGKRLMSKLRRASDWGEVSAGKRLLRFADTDVHRLNREQRFHLVDVLEGRAKPADEKLAAAARALQDLLDEVAEEAVILRVQVRGERERRDFVPLENYYPHAIPPVDALKHGPVRKDVVENLVRRGVRKSREGAERFLDDYTEYVESGKRQESLLEHLVESGQARNKAEALAKLQRHREHVKRHGSLEYAREVNLPFWDPEPLRVIPKHLTAASIRLAQIAEFGQDNQELNRLIKEIADAGGNADWVRKKVDAIVGWADRSEEVAEKISRGMRALQGFKLGLAAIPNSTQGILNSLLAADLPSTAVGFAALFRNSGRRLAIQSGAIIDPVLHETMREVSGNVRALERYLRAVGFTQTERANRIIAANAGAFYAKRMLQKLRVNPQHRRARAALEELGIDPDAARRRGKLTADEVLLAAKKFSDLTQFRARPEDMPEFASRPEGKVFFQFKNFSYNQTRLLYRALIRELGRKEFVRAFRNLLILATVFPMAGEVIRDIRALLTGRPRPTDALERYFENLAGVGALGILYDMWESAKYPEFEIAGPTVGTGNELVRALRAKNKAKALGRVIERQTPLIRVAKRAVGAQ